jgi:hypothetical protein
MGKILNFSERLRRSEYRRAAKVAWNLEGSRYLHIGSKVPRGQIDTVELCIVSNEMDKDRRILSRVRVLVDDLRRLGRELDAEQRFHLQLGIKKAPEPE